jgi:hypothetical protein
VSLWRRFRALPAAAQAAAWLGLAAAYTVALVLILGGGGDAPAPGAPQAVRTRLDARERKVADDVEGAKVKVVEPNDVADFRRPHVQKVDCSDEQCTVEYTSGLPGRGRIFEDQQQMLARIFDDESIDLVTLRVFRAAAVGANTPAKATEETSPGSPILVTQCRRAATATRAPAGSNVKVPPVPATCKAIPFSQGGNNANPGSAAAQQPPPASSNSGGESGILGGG